MNVILAQLDPQQLQAYCHNAMDTQLTALETALKEAVGAAMRAEEVHLASQQLAVSMFEHSPDLSVTLSGALRLRGKLSQVLDRLAMRAKAGGDDDDRGSETGTGAHDVVPLEPARQEQKSASAHKKRGLEEHAAEETSAKKRKSSASSAHKTLTHPPGQSKEGKSTAALTKALASCITLTEELAKKKNTAERVAGLKSLVQLFNTVHKHLNRSSVIDEIEAMDTLNLVVSTAVSIMMQAKPEMKRHWVLKFRSNIVDLQEQFSDYAPIFDGYTNNLSKIISSFPLTVKEGQQLRGRLRRALEDVKAWQDGKYTIADATQHIRLIAEALESTCPNWTPRTDKVLRDLTAALLGRVDSFKDSRKQTKRMRKLQSWLAELDEQELETRKKTPAAATSAAADAKIAAKMPAKKAAKIKAKKQATTTAVPAKMGNKTAPKSTADASRKAENKTASNLAKDTSRKGHRACSELTPDASQKGDKPTSKSAATAPRKGSPHLSQKPKKRHSQVPLPELPSSTSGSSDTDPDANISVPEVVEPRIKTEILC